MSQGGQGNYKKSKKKNSGRLPPPKVQIQQPNFNIKAGNHEYSNSNSKSDFYEDQTQEEKAQKMVMQQMMSQYQVVHGQHP